jgi:hypothetical protein
MTKPVIVNRATKGSPLTTAEHDQNFTNLQNATVGLKAGSAGTTVTADLNGVITLVAGSGVTLTGDNTAKTITVDAGAANLTSDDVPIGESDLTEITIRPPTGFASKGVTLQFDTVKIGRTGSAPAIKGHANDFVVGVAGSDNYIQFDGGIDTITVLTEQYDGIVAIGADRLSLRAEDAVGSLHECRLELGNYTSTQRSSIATPAEGTILYNSTKDVVEFYGSSQVTWAELGNKRSVRPDNDSIIVDADISFGWVFKDLFTYSITKTNYTATINGNIELPSDISQIGRLYTLHINKSGTAVVGFGVQGVFVSGQSIASGETGTFTYDIEYLGFNQWRLTRV